MMRPRHLLLALWLLGAPQPVAAEPVATPGQYLRLVEEPPGHAHLDTAIVRYGRGPVQVDLVAAIHIADLRYFRQLQQRLRRYERVLFELIAADGQSYALTGVRGTSQLSALQLWLRDKLGLAFQLEEIDYRQRNFVHADLSPDALLAHLRGHWTDTLGMLLRWMLRDAARSTNADGSLRFGELARLATERGEAGRHRALKRALARELAEMGDLTVATAGSDALIARRNEAALAALDREVARGARRLGIFYGGAHMPDLARRLEARGFRQRRVSWLVAWQLDD